MCGEQGSYFVVCCVSRIIVPKRKGAEVRALEKTDELVSDTLHIFACRGQAHTSSDHYARGSFGSRSSNPRFHTGPNHDGIGYQDYGASPQVGERAVAPVESLEPLQFLLLKRNHVL